MKKTIGAILLSAMMVVSLSACGATSVNGRNNTSGTYANGTPKYSTNSTTRTTDNLTGGDTRMNNYPTGYGTANYGTTGYGTTIPDYQLDNRAQDDNRVWGDKSNSTTARNLYNGAANKGTVIKNDANRMVQDANNMLKTAVK